MPLNPTNHRGEASKFANDDALAIARELYTEPTATEFGGQTVRDTLDEACHQGVLRAWWQRGTANKDPFKVEDIECLAVLSGLYGRNLRMDGPGIWLAIPLVRSMLEKAVARGIAWRWKP